MITAIRFNGVGISAFGSLLTGGTSAFARNAVGFVHALERKLQSKQQTLGKDRRVAVGVENYVLHQGEKNHSSPKMALSRPWKGQSNYAGSVLDYEWKCNATITLLIHSAGVTDAQSLQRALQSVIPTMRFANGSIFMVHDQDSFINVIPGNDEKTLKDAIKSVKASRASFITNRDDLVHDGDEFNSFADALALFDTEPELEAASAAPVAMDDDGDEDGQELKKRKKWARGQSGWIIPLERGYVAVTQPVFNRPGCRDTKVASLVVTPVISLGEYISAKRMLSNLNANAFWFSKSDRSVGSFLFNATSFNG